MSQSEDYQKVAEQMRASNQARRKRLNMIIFAVMAAILMFYITGQSQRMNEASSLASKNAQDNSSVTLDASLSSEAQINAVAENLSSIQQMKQQGNFAKVKIEYWQTTKGIKVAYVHSPELPIVDVRMLFNAGSARDGEVEGVAKFTADMLLEGTSEYSVDDLSQAIEDLGIQLYASAYQDMAILSLRSLSDQLVYDQAIDLMQKVLVEPAFNQKSFDRLLQQKLAGLKLSEQRPGHHLSKALNANLFKDHPYAVKGNGTIESLKQIEPDDLRAFHKAYWVASNAVLAIVGDIDIANAKILASQFDQVMHKGQAPVKLLEPQSMAQDQSIHVDFASEQTHIGLATLGIARNHPDKLKLDLANDLIGGSSFTSYLFKNIREERGLAYSVYSHLSARQVAGPFIISMQTKSSSAQEAIDVTKQVLNQYGTQGFSQEDVEKVKTKWLNQQAMQMSSNSDKVASIAALRFYDLPANYFDTLADRISALTTEQVNQVFKDFYTDAKWLQVTVGQGLQNDKPNSHD